ncbi:ThiF family adenylyltransferase [Psychromonas sp.]|uniref:HesA/MoeB/ThiF family protein n=1 Tax=Psychromonas sp. TaxID=1884585 RepID=UPI0035692B1B
MLTDAEILRYSRHLLLEEVGESGQLALKSAKVLIIGMGGLGSPAALYLAAAGVGTIVLSDFDHLEVSNLQRQIAYQSCDTGAPKVTLMKKRLEALNPEIRVRSIKNKMDESQLAMELLLADLVLDCTDNMASRQMINQACVQAKRPLIVGAAIRLEGQLMFFDHSLPDSACYHCLFPNNEEQVLNCSNSGVLGPVVGTIGTLQALEAIKYLTGLPSGIKNKLKLFDAKTLEWQTFAINKDPKCQVCG